MRMKTTDQHLQEVITALNAALRRFEELSAEVEELSAEPEDPSSEDKNE